MRQNIVITPLKQSEDADSTETDSAETDETAADASYEDSETSAQPYEDVTVDVTDIYDYQ